MAVALGRAGWGQGTGPPGGGAASVIVWGLLISPHIHPWPFISLQEVLRPYGAFWLASAFCIFSVLFTLFCVPETKGKTLEQITAHFEGR